MKRLLERVFPDEKDTIVAEIETQQRWWCYFSSG
jgi:hypothetical protein